METWHSLFPCITPFYVGVAIGVVSFSLWKNTEKNQVPCQEDTIHVEMSNSTLGEANRVKIALQKTQNSFSVLIQASRSI